MAIRILLVDDHAMVRQGLRLLLESEPEFEVVGEADDAPCAETAALELAPDVVVTDLLMPGPSGIELTRRLLRRSANRARVVVMTIYGTEAAALEALRAGALGFVSKTVPATEMFQAIREAHAGRRHVSAPFSKAAIERALEGACEDELDPYAKLTSREREVLQLAAQGLTSPAIAKRLFISPRTAETHRARVLRKLAIRSQTELIFFAIRRGLLWIEPVPTRSGARPSARLDRSAGAIRRTRRASRTPRA